MTHYHIGGGIIMSRTIGVEQSLSNVESALKAKDLMSFSFVMNKMQKNVMLV